MPKKAYRALAPFLLAGVGLILPDEAPAITKSWISLSGSWNIPANWSGSSLPASGVDAVIDNGGSAALPAGVSGTAREFSLGNAATGTLVISGGQVSDFSCTIAYHPGSAGEAFVTSGSWGNTTSLIVGNSGTGTLAISGGLVTSASGYIGSNGDGTGIVTVSGGTWSSQTLHAGEYRNGTVSLEGPGVISIGNGTGALQLAVNADSTGVLNLGTGGTAGTLNALSVIGGAGTATVNFNHIGSCTFAPQLAGALSVNKQATGTTLLTGSHTYTGATTVLEGTLVVDGALVSTRSVSVHAGSVLKGCGNIQAAVSVNGTLEGTLTAGALSGTGLISPGDGAGLLTVSSVDASGGLDFAFEFTLAGTNPVVGDAVASGNDLLLLTGASPFTGNLTADNTVGIYLENAAVGAAYYGGFLTTLSAAELQCIIENARFVFYVRDNNGNVTFNGKKYVSLDSTFFSLSAVSTPGAAKSIGITEGSDLKVTIVPEPDAWALWTMGIGLLALRRFPLRHPAKT